MYIKDCLVVKLWTTSPLFRCFSVVINSLLLFHVCFMWNMYTFEIRNKWEFHIVCSCLVNFLYSLFNLLTVFITWGCSKDVYLNMCLALVDWVFNRSRWFFCVDEQRYTLRYKIFFCNNSSFNHMWPALWCGFYLFIFYTGREFKMLPKISAKTDRLTFLFMPSAWVSFEQLEGIYLAWPLVLYAGSKPETSSWSDLDSSARTKR